MKVHYDNKVDAVYIQLSDEIPDGVIEITDDIHVDVTPNGKIVGIEILDSSNRIPLDTLLSYQLELDENPLGVKSH